MGRRQVTPMGKTLFAWKRLKKVGKVRLAWLTSDHAVGKTAITTRNGNAIHKTGWVCQIATKGGKG